MLSRERHTIAQRTFKVTQRHRRSIALLLSCHRVQFHGELPDCYVDEQSHPTFRQVLDAKYGRWLWQRQARGPSRRQRQPSLHAVSLQTLPENHDHRHCDIGILRKYFNG